MKMFRLLLGLSVFAAGAAIAAGCESTSTGSPPASTTCTTGSTMCGALCVATQTDNANCGACGNVCPSGRVCSAGTCSVSCLAGATLCSDKCVDTNQDAQNCGTCGKACGNKQLCSAGTCVGDTCADGIKNGDETDVDCGGSCGKCATGKACSAPGDCSSSLCTSNVCEACADLTPFASLVAPTAFDGSAAGDAGPGSIIDLGPQTFPANFDFTFTGRVSATNLDSFGRIFDFGPADANNFRFHQNMGAPTGTGRVAVGPFDFVLDVPTYWSYSKFIGVAVKYQTSTQTLTLYKDGAVAGTLTSVVIPAGARTNLLIGGSNWGGLPSSEPPSVMTTVNLRFFFNALSDACIAKLTQ